MTAIEKTIKNIPFLNDRKNRLDRLRKFIISNDGAIKFSPTEIEVLMRNPALEELLVFGAKFKVEYTDLINGSVKIVKNAQDKIGEVNTLVEAEYDVSGQIKKVYSKFEESGNRFDELLGYGNIDFSYGKNGAENPNNSEVEYDCDSAEIIRANAEYVGPEARYEQY